MSPKRKMLMRCRARKARTREVCIEEEGERPAVVIRGMLAGPAGEGKEDRVDRSLVYPYYIVEIVWERTDLDMYILKSGSAAILVTLASPSATS